MGRRSRHARGRSRGGRCGPQRSHKIGEANEGSPSSSSPESSSKSEGDSSLDAGSSLFLLFTRSRLRSRFACSRVDQAQRRSFQAFARATASRLLAREAEVFVVRTTKLKERA